MSTIPKSKVVWAYGDALQGFPFLGEIEWSLLEELYRFDPNTAGHSVRVAMLLKDMIGREHRLPNGERFRFEDLLNNSGISTERLLRAALLHDIGKLRIAPELLFKPGRYTPEEKRLVGLHEQYSKEILLQAGFGLEAEIAGEHHGRFGLEASARYYFPQLGKWLSVCDLLQIADIQSALTSARVYKPSYSPLEVLALIAQDAEIGKIGTEAVFFHLRSEMAKVSYSYGQRPESSEWHEIVNLSQTQAFLRAEFGRIRKAVRPETGVSLVSAEPALAAQGN